MYFEGADSCVLVDVTAGRIKLLSKRLSDSELSEYGLVKIGSQNQKAEEFDTYNARILSFLDEVGLMVVSDAEIHRLDFWFFVNFALPWLHKPFLPENIFSLASYDTSAAANSDVSLEAADDLRERFFQQVFACSYYVKRRVDCLTVSVLGLWYFRRHGLDVVLRLGFAHDPFSMHAWLELSGKPFTDFADVSEYYTPIQYASY